MLIFVLSGCITKPEEYNPRSLTWSVDTLPMYGTIETQMSHLWGISNKSVYTVGYGYINIFEYCDINDNDQWVPIELPNHMGISSLEDIHGFSEDNIYAVGLGLERESKLIHFDGYTWEEIDIPSKGGLHCIHGTAPDNIWAAGNKNTLFHYDGEQWETDSLPNINYTDPDASILGSSMTGDSTYGFYLAAYKYGHGSDYYLFHYNGRQWKEIEIGHGINKIWLSPSGTLYRTNSWGVHKYKNNKWTKIFEEVWAIGIHGTTDNNIFITGHHEGSHVFHYNGHDWFEYDELFTKNAYYYSIFTINEEVFITGQTDSYPSKTIIWHGE